jgi:hypothetical protein
MTMQKYAAVDYAITSDTGNLYDVKDVDRELDRKLGIIQEQAAEIIHLTVRVEDADTKIAALREHGDNQMFELNMLRVQCKELNDKLIQMNDKLIQERAYQRCRGTRGFNRGMN